MGKMIAVSGKFTEEECEQIEIFAEVHNMNKSQVLHELVMKGMREAAANDDGVRSVGFRFLENYAYFWKGKTYRGTLYGEDVGIRFGGEWMNYRLSDLPVEVVD